MEIKLDKSNLLRAPAEIHEHVLASAVEAHGKGLKAPAKNAKAPAKKAPAQKSNQTNNDSGQPNTNGLDALEIAYLYIFESVQIDHDAAQTQAKTLEANAAAQNRMIGLESAMKFYTLGHSQLYHKQWGRVEWSQVNWKNFHGDFSNLPRTYKWVRNSNVKQSVLESIQFKNQEVSALRGVLEDKLNVLKQNSSIGMTKMNTTSNESQQSLSEGASLMQMLASLTNQITRI